MIDGLLLGVDTCGAAGSVALGRAGLDAAGEATIVLLGESELPGGAFATNLVLSIADLLDGAGARVADLAGIVVVSGPGSFTGIRIGVAAVKAIAEAQGLHIVAVSRLALLANKAGAAARSAVLDAHRGQVYCGLYGEGEPREMLLTAGEINTMGGLPLPVVVCEEAVAQMIENLLEAEPVRVDAPTAWNALDFALSRWVNAEFDDVSTLDGCYLRGADAKFSVR